MAVIASDVVKIAGELLDERNELMPLMEARRESDLNFMIGYVYIAETIRAELEQMNTRLFQIVQTMPTRGS